MAVLWTCSTPAFSSYLRASLEHRFPPVPVSEAPSADAIVVLGGAVGVGGASGVEADLKDTSDRVLHAARLYHAGKAPVIITVSALIACEDPWKSEAIAMRWFLNQLGVPENAIISETGSLNTSQDALKTKRVLESKGLNRVLLVTSVGHMRRALATFRSAGIQAIASPTDYEILNCRKSPSGNEKFNILGFLPDAEALADSTKAIKEYFGFVVYQWRGLIKGDYEEMNNQRTGDGE